MARDATGARRPAGQGLPAVRRLREAGLEDVGDASVYGTLRRLFQAGALSSYVVPSGEGPHRKYYAVTPTGREALRTGAKTWKHSADVLDDLLGTGRKDAA